MIGRFLCPFARTVTSTPIMPTDDFPVNSLSSWRLLSFKSLNEFYHNNEDWIARVRPGRIMFEIEGVPEAVAVHAFALASAKLPVDTRFVKRLPGLA